MPRGDRVLPETSSRPPRTARAGRSHRAVNLDARAAPAARPDKTSVRVSGRSRQSQRPYSARTTNRVTPMSVVTSPEWATTFGSST